MWVETFQPHMQILHPFPPNLNFFLTPCSQVWIYAKIARGIEFLGNLKCSKICFIGTLARHMGIPFSTPVSDFYKKVLRKPRIYWDELLNHSDKYYPCTINNSRFFKCFRFLNIAHGRSRTHNHTQFLIYMHTG